MLERLPEVQVIAEAADGLEAVAAALELQPDLILLDVDLPGLHGIEAARRILNDSPQLKILFISQHTSADVVQVALSTGAYGFLQKMEVGENLGIAVRTVMRGQKFVSRRFRDPIP
jgi:DNA-binding NarL/FixJ family response regulator